MGLGEDRFASAENDEALQALHWTIEEVLQEYNLVQQQMIRLRIASEDVQAIADATQRSKRTVERVLQGFRDRLLLALPKASIDGENDG